MWRPVLPLAVAAALMGVVASTYVAAANDGDPWSAATEQAAEAAVARLGGKTALEVRATVRGIVGLTPIGISGKVQDLATAMRNLGADESALEVHIELPADVLFDVDKAAIRTDAAQALAHLATVIRSYSGPVRLIGHTDSDGSDAHNLDLSVRRAVSVKDWLIAQGGIPGPRLATDGHGESRPVANNDSAANKQRNRRVEVIVRKH